MGEYRFQDGWIDKCPSYRVRRASRWREIPDFTAIADRLRQVAGEEGVLVIKELHGRLVAAEDVKRLDRCAGQHRNI